MKEIAKLMNYRESVRVLDATMRDGGLVNDFYFSDEFVRALYLANIKAGVDEKDIGIISPYADQVKLISERTDIEVKTVDGFQGREKEIIIISTVRSNEYGQIGFLKDLRRLNVAITRAKRKLIIIE